jgi:hypothetical protein
LNVSGSAGSVSGSGVTFEVSKNESINIFGVVNNDVFGCYDILSGVVSDNVINIFGRVAGNIYCAFSNPSPGSSAINNTVIIYEGASLSINSVLLGGRKANDKDDVFSGNALEIYAKNIQIYGINNFEIYNFHLPRSIKKDDAIIDVKAGTGCTKLDRSPETDDPINLSSTTVKAQFQSEEDIPILNVGDKIYLIVSSGIGAGINNAPVNSNIDMNGLFGATLLYDYSFLISTTNTSLYLEVKDSKFDLNPKANNCLEEGTAQILFVNRSLGLLAGKGIREAVDSVSSNNDGSLNSYGKAGAFGVVSVGNLKYGGNTLEINGISFIAGIAKEYMPIVDKKLVLGAFLEHGEGEYTVKTSYDQDTILGHLSGKTEAKGNPQYMGYRHFGKIWIVECQRYFWKDNR